ncbi:MAG: glycosyltransferase family 4 protein [Candidatus Desulforudis sp.]|nr:glycosyltransferase family 4 protein [Desulforudis sp.]
MVTVGEPLPIDGGNDRLHRTGLLAEELVQSGHRVTWWTSTFDHVRKSHRYSRDHRIVIGDGFELVLLHSLIGYRKNVSVARIINHYVMGRKFLKQAPLEPDPDLVLSSFPTIELSAFAVAYGKAKGIPVIVDVRDLWPDIIVDSFPTVVKPLVNIVLLPYFRMTDKLFRRVTAIVGVSDKYLDFGLSYAKRKRGTNDAVFPLGYRSTTINDETRLRVADNLLKEMGVDARKLICWFIGHFGKTYDLSTVIEVARRMDDSETDRIQFVFSGTGERYSEWRRNAEGLTNTVFTGWIDAIQIAQMMRVSSIGLMAYAKHAPQGLPNKLFEYLSAGLPVVSSLQGETKDFLSQYDCGVSYQAGDPSSLYDNLSSVCNNDSLRKRMGLNGKRVFSEFFSADILYPKFVTYLQYMRNHKKEF